MIAENIELVIKPKNVNSIHNVELEYIVNGEPKPVSQLRQVRLEKALLHDFTSTIVTDPQA